MNVPNFSEWKNFSKGFTDIKEAEILWKVCINTNPKLILEIGRRLGMSTRLFAMIAKENCGRVISVDGNPLTSAEVMLTNEGLIDHVDFINHWSPWIEFDPSWELDFLYIDGDHKYISALVDYHVFNFFVKPGGIIAFHDAKYPPVAEAIKQACKRDRLEHIDSAKQMAIFKKADKARRVYFQFPNYEFKTI